MKRDLIYQFLLLLAIAGVALVLVSATQSNLERLGVDSGFEFDTHNLRFSYTSMTTPTQIFDFNMQTQTRELRKQQEIPSGHSPQDYVTRRIFATATDQTKIPISILFHKDTAVDGSAP